MTVAMNSNKAVLSAAIAAALWGVPAEAQEKGARRALVEVVVTARRAEESLQDVPVSVSALGGDDIEELGITNFSDYIIQLPNVTAGGSGPGQNTIYIRGIASTTPNLTTAGVAGLAPNVAFYLDDQPLSQPGRNLDVYAADLKRIEVLSGPQGTLFGASSQAGNVRLITNKPDLNETYGSVRFGANSIAGGDNSSNIEAMLNLPISENFGLRGVIYHDSKGGWIDNVAGTVDASAAGRFRPAGTPRDNGVPVSPQRGGFQSTADLSNVNFLPADNARLVRDDINGTDYTGGRIAARWDINDNWQLDVAHATQDIDSDGVFFADPTVGDLEIQRYVDDRIEDTFDNTSWTLKGLFGELEVVYTGAFTDRQTDQIADYTDYLFVAQYLPYYICDGSVSYPGAGGPSGTCQPPNLFVASSTGLEVQTHELRFTTDQSKKWRLQGGVFLSDLELTELNDFTYPGSVNAVGFDGVTTGFAPNYPLTNTAVTGEIGNAAPGYFSDPGPFPAGVVFRNDILRTDKQLGFFAELNYDFNDEFGITVGARNYDIEVDFEGSANGSFFNLGSATDAQAFGTNISAQFSPNNTVGAPDKAVADGTIFKLSANWRPDQNQLYYATWSEGFRPGLLNRPGGAAGPNNFTVPFALDTDEVTNIEIGMKSDYLDSTLRINAALFQIDIERLQTTIFDPSISNLFFSDNAADAKVTGLEADVTWLPEWSERLTFSGAISLLDTEITKIITPTDDVRLGDDLAFAPSVQGTLRARYEWDLSSGWNAHIMPMASWSSDSFSDIITINRDQMSSWAMFGINAGISNETWSVDLVGSNLGNRRAEVARSFVFDRQRVTYAQPRTLGIRASYRF